MPVTRREFLKQGLTAAATLSLGVLADSDAAAKQKLAAVSKSATRKLRERLKGEVILPDGPKYDAARRIWNPGIDRHPAMIARCAETSDVVSVVNFAANMICQSRCAEAVTTLWVIPCATAG
jgi:hypothetical protein